MFISIYMAFNGCGYHIKIIFYGRYGCSLRHLESYYESESCRSSLDGLVPQYFHGAVTY